MRALLRSAFFALAVAVSLTAVPAAAESVDIAALMAPGPLEEMTLGDPAAPVTVIEYASLTCPHCANFHRTVFDAVRAKYIDTGKVYFILREFPLDQLALVAIMAARCAPQEDFFAIIDTLFDEQEAWAFVESPGTALVAQLGKHGFGEEALRACLDRTELAEAVIAVEQRGQEQFGVDGTPAFFINGERYVGEMDLAAFEALLQSLLDKS